MSSGNFDQLFTGNTFYPLDRPIYFNSSTFSTAVLTLPIFLVTKDPYICLQAAIFFSYILCSLGMVLLARNLKLDYVASFLAAFIFSFSEPRFSVTHYLHLITIQWMPFVLLFVHKYFDKGKRIYVYWAVLFYLMQITASAYHGIFFSMLLLLFVVILFFQQNNFTLKKIILDVAPLALIIAAVAWVYFSPYLQEANEFGFKRSIVDHSTYGAPLATFFSLPDSYFFSSWTSSLRHIDGSTSPGYLSIILTTAGILILRKNKSPKFLIDSRVKYLTLWIMLITSILFLFKPYVASFGEKFYSDLYLHPQVVTTAILSPFFLVMTGYFFSTKFFRNIYDGLTLNKIFLLYFSIAVLAFIVSLGPIIKLYGNQHIMINPIAIFIYYTFPGLSSIRAISRMSILIPLGLGITAGVAYMLIKEQIVTSRYKKVFTFLVLTFFVFEMCPSKGLYAPYKPGHEIPKVYKWLKEAPDGVVLEWPMAKFFSGDEIYQERSMIHQKKLVNGYAAFEWDGRKKLAELEDLSGNSALMSLYAFGINYLVLHDTYGKFPKWAGKNIGEFQQIEKFNNALIYLNKKAKVNFLSESFLDHFSAVIKYSDKESRLVLKFQSPNTHYVTKNKKMLKVRVSWESDPNSSHYEWPFYPTLWRDGDSYELILDKNSKRVPKFVELIYSNSEKKGEKVFRKTVVG